MIVNFSKGSGLWLNSFMIRAHCSRDARPRQRATGTECRRDERERRSKFWTQDVTRLHFLVDGGAVSGMDSDLPEAVALSVAQPASSNAPWQADGGSNEALWPGEGGSFKSASGGHLAEGSLKGPGDSPDEEEENRAREAPGIRGPIVAANCRLSGNGLNLAALFRDTSFTIDTMEKEGGQTANFFVMLRSSTQGTRIRTRITDNNDGTYTVTYKPLVSGRINVRIMLNQEDLPGSPTTCLVHDTAPCASQCTVEGAALSEAISRRPEHFFVTFRDPTGQLTHATDLDVFVEHKVEHPDDTGGSHQDALKPFGLSMSNQEGRDRFIVGSKPLAIRSSLAMDSERLGQVSPGASLTVLKIESSPESGVLCACIVIDEDSSSLESWREIYAQDPTWRTPSWRKSEKEGMAAQIRELARAQVEEEEARDRERQRLAEEAEIRAKALAEEEAKRLAAEEEAQTREEARMKAREAGMIDEDGKKKKKKPKKGQPSPKPKPKPKASAPAPSTPTSTGAPDAEGHDSNGSSTLATTAAEPPAAEPELAPTPESAAPVEGAETDETSTATGRKESARVLSSRGSAKGRLGRRGSLAAQLPELAPPQQSYGWVTIVKDGQHLVMKPLQRLPANLKQFYAKQWERRMAIDTEHEHEKLLIREQEVDRLRDLRTKAAKSGRTSRISNEIGSLPQNLYLKELEADPNKIGFAYGGVDPGRLRAKGQLIQQHRVHYSIGLCGTYQLHVTLRHLATPLPGSPFTLRVAPGAAHGPSTRIRPSEIPLRGVFELVTEEGSTTSTARCTCKMVLQAGDKMGNSCTSGGAVITCGVTETPQGVVVESKVTDQGDGTYLLEWWSASSGVFQVYIKIDGLHVVGSPATMLLTSGTPDIAKTEVISFPPRVEAGKPYKTRIKCKDQYRNPALPGRDFRFGLATTSLLEKDSQAWRQAKAIVLTQTIIGEELELSFTCTQAGEHKAYLFAMEGAREARARKAGASAETAVGDEDSPNTKAPAVSPNAKSPVRIPNTKAALSDTSAPRTILPGCPINVKVTSAPPSAAHSHLDGILQNVHGIWQKVTEAALAKSAEGGDVKAEDDAALQIGDTIRIKPEMHDQFGNSTAAHEESLGISVRHPSYGLEQLRCAPQSAAGAAGQWSHDVRYELKRKGPHVLHVTLDGVHIAGSPVEWNVKFRPP